MADQSTERSTRIDDCRGSYTRFRYSTKDIFFVLAIFALGLPHILHGVRNLFRPPEVVLQVDTGDFWEVLFAFDNTVRSSDGSTTMTQWARRDISSYVVPVGEENHAFELLQQFLATKAMSDGWEIVEQRRDDKSIDLELVRSGQHCYVRLINISTNPAEIQSATSRAANFRVLLMRYRLDSMNQ